MDPTQTEADKLRFLENLWHVQATYRSRAGQSVVLCADEQEVESKSGRVVIARTYFNVYQRTAFLQELKKVRLSGFICFSVMVIVFFRQRLWFTSISWVQRIRFHSGLVLPRSPEFECSLWLVDFVVMPSAQVIRQMNQRRTSCKPKGYRRG
jgi:hypothetical protein